MAYLQHVRLKWIFFHNSEKIAVSCLRKAIKFHVGRDVSSEPEFGCSVVCMSQFHCGNEVKQGHKIQTNKL